MVEWHVLCIAGTMSRCSLKFAPVFRVPCFLTAGRTSFADRVRAMIPSPPPRTAAEAQRIAVTSGAALHRLQTEAMTGRPRVRP